MLQRLSLYELHRVEVTAPSSAEVYHRCDVRMAPLCRRPGFAQETKLGRLITQISLADEFQCDGAVQIDVERLVSDPHRTATQLDRSTVFGLEEFVMLKAHRHRFSRRRGHRLPRRGG